jgi:hypothetical protein
LTGNVKPKWCQERTALSRVAHGLARTERLRQLSAGLE